MNDVAKSLNKVFGKPKEKEEEKKKEDDESLLDWFKRVVIGKETFDKTVTRELKQPVDKKKKKK
jgi:hypothetical protein